jgi:hypothetical protein
VTGTYPNFTISSPTAGAGTVTSIDVSGGTTGLTTSGGPVTSSGTITLAGTLNVANGGTGATTLTSGYLLKGNGTSAVSASVIYDDGTNAMIGGTSAFGRFTVEGNTNANLDIWIRNNNAGSSSRTGLVLNASGNSWRMGMGSTANNSNALTWNLDVGGANTEYMRLTTGGNLGVGSSSPSARITAQVNSGNYILDLVNGSEAPFALRTYNHGSGSAPGLVFTQGLYYNTTENASIKFYRGAGATGGYLGFTVTDGTERLSINSSGNVIAAVDMRAPIFYDSNNTSYYLDPASGSNLNGTLVNSGGTAMTAGWNRNMMLAATFPVLVFNSANTKYAGIGVDYTTASAAMRFWVNASSSDVVTGTNAMNINTGGYVEAGGSFRSPIFYDLDNTAYYVDPAGTSALSTVTYGSSPAGGGGGGRTVPSPGSPYSLRQDFGSDNTGWRYGIAKNVSGTVTIQFFVSDSGIAEAVGDMRAPIFYDSNNTGFYVDPAGTTLLNTFTCAGSITTSSSVTVGNGATASYIYMADSDEGTRIIHCNSNRVGFLAQNGNWGSWCEDDGSWRTDHAMYSPVYYDLNNTGYYVDPASTSVVNIVNVVGGIGATTGGAGNDPYGKIAVTGATDANYAYYGLTRAGQFGMGMGIDTSNIFWVGATSGGYAATRTSVYFQTNTSGDVTASSSFRAPIFYDSNDTNYYINPNSSSAVKGAIVIGPNNSYTQFIRLGGEGQASDMATVCTTNGNLHIDSKTNFHIYANYASNGNIYLNNGGGFTEGITSIRAPIFYDSNNTNYYVDAAGTSVLNSVAGYSLRNVEDVSVNTPYGIYFSSNLNTDYAVYREAGAWTSPYPDLRIAFYTGIKMGAEATYGGMRFYNSSNMATQVMSINNSADGVGANNVYVNNSLQAGSSLRAPIYYDTTNTAYYWEFADGGVSNINTFINGLAYFKCNFGSGAYSGAQSSPPLQVYSSDGGTAMMSFHRSGAYAVNFGLDPDNVLRIGGWSASANRLQMDMSGNLTMAGNVTAYSDARLKENVATVSNALGLVGKMRGVTYTRKDTGEDGVGVIAQEMLEVMPQVVQQGIGDDDTLSVAYGNLVGVLIEAIKELEARVAELEGK